MPERPFIDWLQLSISVDGDFKKPNQKRLGMTANIAANPTKRSGRRWRVTIADEDTDSDTLTNAEEAELGSCPSLTDTDGEGLTDEKETALGISPMLPDTDGDGAPDGTEVTGDSNPNAPASIPQPDPFLAAECKSFSGSQLDPFSTFQASDLLARETSVRRRQLAKVWDEITRWRQKSAVVPW